MTERLSSKTVDTDHEGFSIDLHGRLSSGLTFIGLDIDLILEGYGWVASNSRPAHDVMPNHIIADALAALEPSVKLGMELYKGKAIYYDANLPREDTNIDETKARVDKMIVERHLQSELTVMEKKLAKEQQHRQALGERALSS